LCFFEIIAHSRDKFIFDTGALTFINQKAANELGFEKGNEMPTMKEDEKAYLTKPVSISLGEMKVEDFIIPIMDIQQVFSSGLIADGFIGSDFLRFFNTTIDYENKEIIIAKNYIKGENSKKKYQTKIETPFPFRFPTFNIEINDTIKVKGIIDTGSPYSIVFPLSYAEKIDGPLKKQLIKSKGCIAKWPGTSSDYNYLLRIQNLKIGEFEVKDIPVLFADLPKQFTSALIGKEFLDEFLIQINYPSNEMFLIPDKHLNFNTNIFTTGLALRKGKNNKTYIKGFWEGSAADNNLIKIKDEIISINGENTSELSIEDINNILEDNQIKDIELKIRDNKNFRTVILKKEMLFPEIVD